MEQGDHLAAPRRSFVSRLIEVGVFVAVVVVMSWALRAWVMEPFEVPSGSMEDTIMPGNRIVAEKVTPHFAPPKPGEVVTFDSPEVAGRVLVKRVIATAGQTIDLRGGHVYVDGVERSEPYVRGLPTLPLTPAPGVSISYPFTVPAGHVWVMGDNRTNSADSRYFGPVPTSSVFGHAFAVFWPLQEFHWL